MGWNPTTQLIEHEILQTKFHYKLVDATAAGGPWVVFEIVECTFPELVGKRLCCHMDYDNLAEAYRCEYRAKMEWDDGFISNTTDETLGYHSYDPPDGTGTPMGGEIVEDLDGLLIYLPSEAIDAHMAERDADKETT